MGPEEIPPLFVGAAVAAIQATLLLFVLGSIGLAIFALGGQG